MITRELGLHLSENATDHVYRQTPEEGLVHRFRTEREKGATHRDSVLKDGVTGVPRKWAELLSQEYVWDFMERVEGMGIHMFDGRGDMKLNALHRTLLGPSGGVSRANTLGCRMDQVLTCDTLSMGQIVAYTVWQMETYACQCFNGVEVEEDDVDALVLEVRGKDAARARAARGALRAIYRDMKAEAETMKGARGAVYTIRECMDVAFVQHLGPNTDVDVVFGNQRSHRWKEAMEDYLEEVIDQLPNVIMAIDTTDAPEEGEERDALDSLQWSVAKVKVLLEMLRMSTPEKSLGLMPFVSRSVYSHMVRHLDVIPDALTEVSPSTLSERVTNGAVSRISLGS